MVYHLTYLHGLPNTLGFTEFPFCYRLRVSDILDHQALLNSDGINDAKGRA